MYIINGLWDNSWSIYSNIPYIGLLDTLRADLETEYKQYYYTVDGHMTPLGNHRIAELIAQKIYKPPFLSNAK